MGYFTFLEAHGGFDPTAEQPDDESRFQCACQDPECIGDDTDPGNIRIGKEWFASHCKVAANHPEVIRARELDDLWNRSRR